MAVLPKPTREHKSMRKSLEEYEGASEKTSHRCATTAHLAYALPRQSTTSIFLHPTQPTRASPIASSYVGVYSMFFSFEKAVLVNWDFTSAIKTHSMGETLMMR